MCSISKSYPIVVPKNSFEKFHKISRKPPVTKTFYSFLGFRLWFLIALLLPHSLFSPLPFLIVQILYVSGNFSPRKLLWLDLTDKFYSNLVVLNVSFGEVFWLDCCNSRWKEQRKRLSPKNAFSWWKLMRTESSLKMTSKFRVYLFNPSRPNPG